MRNAPSAELIELLSRIHPALPRRIPSIARQVKKLTAALPQFDSVWIDALAKSRLLTPYQARTINSGRGQELLVGQFVIQDKIVALGFADVFLAHRVAPSATQPQKLSVLQGQFLITCGTNDGDKNALERLQQLLRDSTGMESPQLCVVRETGVAEGLLWMRAEYDTGVLASEWLSQNGRLPALAVLQLARQLLTALCELERRGLVHGNLCPKSLLLHDDGQVTLLFPGLRGSLRPVEIHDDPCMPFDCYESIAPERITRGAEPNIASDIFSYGCLLVYLLTGRAAIPGATRLAKISYLTTSRIPDVRDLAADTPPVLAEMILACTEPDPSCRPRSFEELAELLGPYHTQGDKLVSRAITTPARWLSKPTKSASPKSPLRQYALELSTAVSCLLLAIVSWKLLIGPQMKAADVSQKIVASASPTPDTKPELDAAANHVVPASFHEKSAQPAVVSKKPQEPEPLFLPSGRTLRLTSLTPAAGQLICGESGNRVVVAVPESGLVVEASGVRFKDLDFVCEDENAIGPLLVLKSAQAEFENCSFTVHGETVTNAAAIRWQTASVQDGESWDAEIDQLVLTNCVFMGVSSAIDRTRHGEAEIKGLNILCAGSESFLRTAVPDRHEHLAIDLDRCTLRNVTSLLELTGTNFRTNSVQLTTRDCVICPRVGGAVIEVENAEGVADQCIVIWKGQGTLIETDAVLIASRGQDAELTLLDEQLVNITGVVRSQLQFVGADSRHVAGSELLRWVAPRKSPEPPGAAIQALPLNPVRLTSGNAELRYQ